MKRVYIDNDGDFFEGLEAEVLEQIEDNLAEAGYFESTERESKGGSIMNKLFKKSGKTTEIEINKEEGTIKRKAKVIGEVVSMSIKSTFNDPWTHVAVASVGLNQGLKYKGSFKAGGKAGLAAAAVIAGYELVGNLVINKEVIKDA